MSACEHDWDHFPDGTKLCHKCNELIEGCWHDWEPFYQERCKWCKNTRDTDIPGRLLLRCLDVLITLDRHPKLRDEITKFLHIEEDV